MLVDHLRPTTLTLDEILEGLRALRSKSRPVRRVERGGDWAQVAACKLLAAEDETRRQLWSCQKEVAETGSGQLEVTDCGCLHQWVYEYQLIP